MTAAALFLLFSILLLASGPLRPAEASGRADRALGGERLFALLIRKGDEDWYRREAKGFSDKCRELGVIPLVFDNQMNPNITLANIDLAIDREIAGIAVVVPEQRMSRIIVDRAFASNIPIVSLDLKLIDHQGRQLAPHFGVSDSLAGYSAGVWLAEQIKLLGWDSNPSLTLGFAALKSDSTAEYRERTNSCRRAILEWLSVDPSASIFEIEYPGADAVAGLLAMQELLNQHPEITNWVVYSATDEGAVGAVRALEQVELGKNSIACGIQAGRAFREFEAYPESAFGAAVYFDPYMQGSMAAEALYRYAEDGRPIKAINPVPYRIITRDNYMGVRH